MVDRHTNTHTETKPKYFNRHGRPSQSEENECMLKSLDKVFKSYDILQAPKYDLFIVWSSMSIYGSKSQMIKKQDRRWIDAFEM